MRLGPTGRPPSLPGTIRTMTDSDTTREPLPEDLQRVEKLQNAYASMKEGMLWDWVTFPEWLDSLDRMPKGVNCISYMPVAPLMTTAARGVSVLLPRTLCTSVLAQDPVIVLQLEAELVLGLLLRQRLEDDLQILVSSQGGQVCV